MKIFIYYKPKQNRDTVEGVRLRKTLKGSCELMDIPWVNSLKAEFDIAHFISPRDLKYLRKIKKRGVKCIVSAFYCENDPYARFLIEKSAQKPLISSDGVAICNEADLVLVPNEYFVTLSKEQGIRTPVQVLAPSVDLSRFKDVPGEERIFPRYFGVRPNQAVVISSGRYSDKLTLNRFAKIASLCPDIEFYFFGSNAREFSLWSKLERWNKRSSPNCHFVPSAKDDIYRSAIHRSIARLCLNDPREESLGILDAFAARLQVVVLGERPFSKWIIGDKTAKIFSNEEDIAGYLIKLYNGEAETTIEGGFTTASERRIENGALHLKNIYESLLKQEEES